MAIILGPGDDGPNGLSRLCGPSLWSSPMRFAATRRAFVYGLAATIAAPGARAADASSAVARVAAIEAEAGGRLGVAVIDQAGARRLAHRADERFAMCSTSRRWPPPRR